MFNYGIVATLYVLVHCALLMRASDFDNRGEELVLKLLNDPADDAGVATSANHSIFKAFTFVDFIIQCFFGRIKGRIADAAIPGVSIVC